jgi:hypothetical protein
LQCTVFAGLRCSGIRAGFCRTKPVVRKKTHAVPISRLRLHGRKKFERDFFGGWAGKFPARELSTGIFFGFSNFEPEKIRKKSFRTEKKVSVIHPIVG